MATILDLTHTIGPGMPVYPGTEPPRIQQANTVEKDGFAEKLISMYSHTGTHIDAPAHMLAGSPSLDQWTADRYLGPACALDASAPGLACIDLAFLQPHASHIKACDFLLFFTGWSRRWGQDSYFSGFPILAPEAAQWLAQQGLKGIGVDAISVDPVGSVDFRNHLILFRAGMILIENLTGLEPLVGRSFTLSCLPLKLEQADGSPVRAVAMLG